MNTTIEDPDQALEYITSLIGEDFEKALGLSAAILANPSDYTGPQAAMTAIKMAGYRYRIGILAQYWKNKCVGGSNRQDKLVKDALMCAYDGLVEVINTLKLTARHEHDLSQR